MQKPTLALATMILVATGATGLETEGRVQPLKEERVTVEYTVTSGEATIIVEAESESNLDMIEVRSPTGIPVLALRSQSGQDMSLSGFVIESQETDLTSLLEIYSEGRYALRARTSDGILLQGGARLSHQMCGAPQITNPPEDALVPHDLVQITWNPDSHAVGYRVVLEQGNNDNLTVTLPADVLSFTVPVGVLAPGLDSHVEVGAIAPNGNCTVVERTFTTF